MLIFNGQFVCYRAYFQISLGRWELGYHNLIFHPDKRFKSGLIRCVTVFKESVFLRTGRQQLSEQVSQRVLTTLPTSSAGFKILLQCMKQNFVQFSWQSNWSRQNFLVIWLLLLTACFCRRLGKQMRIHESPFRSVQTIKIIAAKL